MRRDDCNVPKNHSSSHHLQFPLAPLKCLLCLTTPCPWRIFVLWVPQQVSWISPVGFLGGIQVSEFSLPTKDDVISLSWTKIPRTSLNPPWEHEKHSTLCSQWTRTLRGTSPTCSLKLWPKPSSATMSCCIHLSMPGLSEGFTFLPSLYAHCPYWVLCKFMLLCLCTVSSLCWGALLHL